MTVFHVPEMSCNHCSKTIENSVKSIDPTARLSFNMQTRNVDVETILTDRAILKAINEAGYDARTNQDL